MGIKYQEFSFSTIAPQQTLLESRVCVANPVMQNIAQCLPPNLGNVLKGWVKEPQNRHALAAPDGPLREAPAHGGPYGFQLTPEELAERAARKREQPPGHAAASSLHGSFPANTAGGPGRGTSVKIKSLGGVTK